MQSDIQRLFGLIGFPLSHSFSAQYFNDKFKREGLAYEYRLFPIETISLLPDLLKNYPLLTGLNVTIPYKVKVIEYLDSLTPEAKEIGAINTISITRREGKLFLTGHNTDAPAFEKTLLPHLKPWHTHALILGTGGAAMAVAYVLSKLNIKYFKVSREKKADDIILYDEIDEALINQYKLIINCSPVGMHPLTDNFPPIPYNMLSKEHLLYDLVYNPQETLFLKKGKERNTRIMGGLQMLYCQADLAWEYWMEGLQYPDNLSRAKNFI